MLDDEVVHLDYSTQYSFLHTDWPGAEPGRAARLPASTSRAPGKALGLQPQCQPVQCSASGAGRMSLAGLSAIARLPRAHTSNNYTHYISHSTPLVSALFGLDTNFDMAIRACVCACVRGCVRAFVSSCNGHQSHPDHSRADRKSGGLLY